MVGYNFEKFSITVASGTGTSTSTKVFNHKVVYYVIVPPSATAVHYLAITANINDTDDYIIMKSRKKTGELGVEHTGVPVMGTMTCTFTGSTDGAMFRHRTEDSMSFRQTYLRNAIKCNKISDGFETERAKNG